MNNQQAFCRNPRPEDHEEYWERGLDEMRSLDPQIELIPASFKVPNADCFDLYFTGVHGARVGAVRAEGVERVAVRDPLVADAVSDRRQLQRGGGHSFTIAKEVKFFTQLSRANSTCAGQNGEER